MITRLLSGSPARTKEVAQNLARALVPGDVIALSGPLGAGKTMFVQGLAAGLDVLGAPVTSPTFVLLREYEGRVPLFHFDFYRLRKSAELDGIGYEEYFEGEGVTAVEWADRFPGLFGKAAINVRIRRVSDEEREIEIETGPGLAAREVDIVGAVQDLSEPKNSHGGG